MNDDPRTRELAENLHAVQKRVAVACAAAGRPPASVIVVTKFFGADDVRRLAALGVHDIGENRDQEAVAKHSQCLDLDLTWHFIGQLQTNKAKSVVGYADLVHTVDRTSLVRALDKAAHTAGKVQDVLIQVNLDPPARAGRGGVAPPGVDGLLTAVRAADGLRLRGVMGVAPLGEDPAPAFAALAAVAAHVRGQVPEADIISAGMSSDLEVAVAYGATHLRIGTAVMGSRPTVGYRPSKGGKNNEGEAH
ncbi:MAG: YggS family pyridoxal phosphate-dependent enzyme [Micrococcales bacterium]|nr:YggS family pyridoxal phosphate-dependent enzyme [Micrococcales bacterium]